MGLGVQGRIGVTMMAVGVAGLIVGPRVRDSLFPKEIRGKVLDAVYVAGGPGAGNVLFQTVEGKDHGHVFTYSYDPLTRQVMARWRKDYRSGLPTDAVLFLGGASVWNVSRKSTEVRALDPTSGQERAGTADFVARFPPLAVGLASVELNSDRGQIPSQDVESPASIGLKTADGRSFTYVLQADALRPADARDPQPPDRRQVVSGFALEEEQGGGERRQLFWVTGPRDELRDLRNASDPNWVKSQNDRIRRMALTPDDRRRMLDAHMAPPDETPAIAVTRLTPDIPYLDGLIVYKDDEIAVVLHQDRIGETARRSLTCVGADGRQRWTAPQAELFPQLELADSRPFSSMFFIKDKLAGARAGGLFVFKLQGAGMKAFDVASGQPRWSFAMGDG